MRMEAEMEMKRVVIVAREGLKMGGFLCGRRFSWGEAINLWEEEKESSATQIQSLRER